MRSLLISLLLAVPLACAAQQPGAEAAAPSQAAPMQTEFHVRYVSGPNVYIDAGRDAGLAEGTRIVLKQSPSKASTAGSDAPVEPGIGARLTVVSIATTSAVCQVDSSSRDLVV